MSDRFTVVEPDCPGVLGPTYKDISFWENQCRKIAAEANQECAVLSARVDELRQVISLFADGGGNTANNIIYSLAKENNDLRARLSLLDGAEFPASGI